jgi:hypothetical protein
VITHGGGAGVGGGGLRCDSASVSNGAVWFNLLLWCGFLLEYCYVH